MTEPIDVWALVTDLEAQLCDQAELLDRFAALYPAAGEHTAANDPWRNALEFLTTLCAVVGVRAPDPEATP